MRAIYSLLIWFMGLALRMAAIFNQKAKDWIEGRKGQFVTLQSEFVKNDRIIWFHCSSLGEFEQGRPVIHAIRESFPKHKILLTFFSPSGYEVRKSTEVADYVYYLPLDTPANAKRFIAFAQPRLAFFVKYEYWFNYIIELSENKIPTFFISAIFRPGQYLFKPWGTWSVRQLQKVSHFFVQNEQSLALLNKVKIFHAEKSGDTRFDRVIQIASSNKKNKVIEDFVATNPVIVAGSTWQADEELLLNSMKKLPDEYKLIIAPHEINDTRIRNIFKQFNGFNPIRFSNYSPVKRSRILVVDKIGFLAHLYRYAKFAYLGGGFGVGIHNILEAAAWGKPVLFGPKHTKFIEANELLELGSAFSVSEPDELVAWCINLDEKPLKYEQLAIKAERYVKEKAGATQVIVHKVKSFLAYD